MAKASDPTRARLAAVRIVTTLRAAGHRALLAGGCVRDELLGLHPTDYDVATSAHPPQVRALFNSVHQVGEAFGVMLVTLDHTTVEVATFRTDGQYTDKRRPDSVAFADDKADALRRDFTINALFLDPAPDAAAGAPAARSPLGGAVIDHVGGLADLHAGTIRAVGDPHARLGEDHLRALRAVRFAARLGFAIEPATAAAITAHTADLAGISKERIGEELRRMLTHPAPGAPARAAMLLQQLGLDAPTLGDTHLPTFAAGAAPAATPAPPPPLALAALRPAQPHHGPPQFAVALGAWAIDRHQLHRPIPHGSTPPDHRPIVAALRSALCLTNQERDDVASMLAGFSALMSGWLTLPVAAQKRVAARPLFRSAVQALASYHKEVAVSSQEVLTRLASDGIGISPEPLVTGDDLISLGFKPGPGIKSILDQLYDHQLEGRMTSKARGMELARTLGV